VTDIFEKQPSRKKLMAAALRYEQGKQKAPVVVAKGSGVVAEKMEETSFVGNTNKFPVETYFLNRSQTIIKGSIES